MKCTRKISEANIRFQKKQGVKKTNYNEETFHGGHNLHTLSE